MQHPRPISYNKVMGTFDPRHSEGSRTKRMITRILKAPQLSEVPLPSIPMLVGGPGAREYYKWCAWFLGKNLLTSVSIGWIEKYARANDRGHAKAKAGKELPITALEERARFLSKLEGVAGAGRFADP